MSRLADVIVEAVRRDLAADDRGAVPVAIIEHFEKVASLRVRDRCHREVVDHEHVGARDLREHSRIGSISAREGEFLVEPRGAPIEGAMAFTARLLCKRACEIGLACSGRAGDQNVLMFDDPAACSELADLRAVDFTLRRKIDVLHAGVRDPELRVTQRCGESFILALQPFGIDDHAEAFIEGELVHIRFPGLISPGRCHRVESHRLKLLGGWFCQHRLSSVSCSSRSRGCSRG